MFPIRKRVSHTNVERDVNPLLGAGAGRVRDARTG